MNPQITRRDVSLILDVYKYRYLSLCQIQKLHFPSLRTTQRRLKALTSLGFVKAFRAPTIPERIFYLDKAGADVVAVELNLTVEDLQWYRYTRAPKDYYFLRHFLAINDFRILLTQACEESPIQLLGFIPEYMGEKTASGNVKKYLRDRVCDISNQRLEYSHTPDGVFALGKDNNAALFFLEIDRGIEVVGDPEKGLLKSVVFYLNYWAEKKFQRFEKDFAKPFSAFRVLFIIPSQERLRNLREATNKLFFKQPQVKRFLWGTTTGELNRQTLFEPIWLSLDTEDQNIYRIG